MLRGFGGGGRQEISTQAIKTNKIFKNIYCFSCTRGLQMEAEGCADAGCRSVTGMRGQIPLIEPPCSAVRGGSSGVIHLPGRLIPGGERGRPYKTNISATAAWRAGHPRLFFGIFFFLNRTDVAVFPLIFQSYTYLLLFVRLQKKKKKVNPSLGFFKSRWQRKIRKWNYCMVF